MSVRELMSKRSALVDAASALTTNADGMSEADFTEFASLEKKIKGIDAQISAQKSLQDLSSKEAVPVGAVIPASVEGDVYTNESAAEEFGRKKGIQASSTKAFVLGGVVKMLAAGGGNSYNGLQVSTKVYGEAHPVTRALAAGTGASGGFIVPPDYMNEIIEFLRPLARVRAASPRMLPMPRGTLVLPGQASQATAYYGSETSAITASSQTLKQVVATYKKLSALVPITNDMMRYADPAVDAFVRDDLVKVLALKEDAAFLLGDGTQGTPRASCPSRTVGLSRMAGPPVFTAPPPLRPWPSMELPPLIRRVVILLRPLPPIPWIPWRRNLERPLTILIPRMFRT